MTGWFAHAGCQRSIQRHFARLSTRAEDTRMHGHLATCSRCRTLHASFLFSEQLNCHGEDAAARRRERIASSLFPPQGQPSTAAPRLSWTSALSLPTALAAAILVITLVSLRAPISPNGDAPKSAFRSKGAGETSTNRDVGITAYATAPAGPLEPAGKTIHREAALAFAYTNLSAEGFDRLMIFAIDDLYELYWYYPAWTDPASNPRAIRIEPGQGIELPDQVRHPYKGTSLRLFALFSKRGDLSVREVEDIVEGLSRKGRAIEQLERFPLGETAQHVLSFTIAEAQP